MVDMMQLGAYLGPSLLSTARSIVMPIERYIHIIGDEARVRDALAFFAPMADTKARIYASVEQFLASALANEHTCVLIRDPLFGTSGIEALRRIKSANNHSVVIVATDFADVPTAVAAMKAGAFYLVQMPTGAEVLRVLVDEALAR